MMSRECLAFALCVLGLSLSAAERENAAVFVTTGDKSFKEGKFEAAKEMAERALSADSTYAAAHLLMAQSLQGMEKPREAMKSYRNAIAYATKERDAITERKAREAAKKCAPGLLDIALLDQRLIDKLIPLGDKALADRQYDTARTAYQTVLALDPGNLKVKENLDKVEKAVAERGDPVRGRVAAAMLAEVWYYAGNQRKEEAGKIAKELADKLGDTNPGREAATLLANDFGLPKDIKNEIAVAKAELKQIAAKSAPVADVKPVGSSTSTATPTPRPASSSTGPNKPSTGVDVDQIEKLAMEDAKKCPKSALVQSFKDAFNKGKEFYAGATPGTPGNQQKVGGALEQFIRCEVFYMRLEEEKMTDGELSKMSENASMLRYACMKMTILSH